MLGVGFTLQPDEEYLDLCGELIRRDADYYEVAVPLGCFDTEIYPGVYLDPVRIDSEGYIHAPTKPGLGFGIDFNEAKKVTEQVVKA